MIFVFCISINIVITIEIIVIVSLLIRSLTKRCLEYLKKDESFVNLTLRNVFILDPLTTANATMGWFVFVIRQNDV